MKTLGTILVSVLVGVSVHAAVDVSGTWEIDATFGRHERPGAFHRRWRERRNLQRDEAVMNGSDRRSLPRHTKSLRARLREGVGWGSLVTPSDRVSEALGRPHPLGNRPKHSRRDVNCLTTC